MSTTTFLEAGNFTITDNGDFEDGISTILKDGVFVQNFVHPGDELVFRAAVPGITITFDLVESLGNPDLRIDPAPGSGQLPDNIVVRSVRTGGDVSLTAIHAITEGGSDASVDIQADSLLLVAGTGIGTAANAIETLTEQIEAETVTGGINLSNTGPVVVGGISDDAAGLRVVTSGDIRLVNLGSITIADETEADSIRGGDASGDVILVANGFDADIATSVDRPAIFAQAGDVLLTAGRDVLFGRTGSDFNNDVRADGDIVVNAGRSFELSGFADFFADGVGGTTGGNLVVTAGKDISLLSANGTSAGLRASGSAGGDVILTTGAGGAFTVQTSGANAITSVSGDVIVNADRIIIGNTSGITAFGQTVLRPVTPGREIVLGSLVDAAAAIELSDGELDRIFGTTLVVGSGDAGLVRVGAPIAPANVDNWTLQGGSDLLIQSSLTATGDLVLDAGDDIIQTAGTFQSDRLGLFVDQVQGDDGASGAFLLQGSLSIATAEIRGGPDADVLTGTDVPNQIFGGGGNDELTGGPGALSDTLDGGSGRDDLNGGGGDDLLFGGSGRDVLKGGNGSDQLFGGNDEDTLDGDGGADVMEGGAGNDSYRVNHGGDQVSEAGGSGKDLVLASVSFQLPASVENLTQLGGGDLSGRGNASDNKILGNGGDNFLLGYSGADRIEGGAGDDILVGGPGLDILIGGAGEDEFLFNGTPATSNTDRIYDFASGVDQLVLDRDFFPALSKGTLKAGAFRVGTGAQDGDDRIIYNDATGDIFYDPDGSGSASAILFAAVNPGTTLVNADFFVG